MTVIYVTHEQEEALTMSDRIAVMNDGQIAQIGIPDVIYQRPTNLFVADFIGVSNFIGAKVVETNSDCAVVARGENRICVPAVNWLEEGQPITVLLRPERIDILTEAHKERKNVFPAIIQEDLYIGNLNRYLVEVPSWGIVVNVELRNAQDTVRFQTGQNVFISWRVLDTILVKE
jgi:ABC-type Fe3+/spermidine/putrescine transport system ATPase subunit